MLHTIMQYLPDTIVPARKWLVLNTHLMASIPVDLCQQVAT